MVKRGDNPAQTWPDGGASVWDPLRPNVYTLPEHGKN